ncbi:MAG: nucleoside hydrolase [Isosphaeraceae bacterium]
MRKVGFLVLAASLVAPFLSRPALAQTQARPQPEEMRLIFDTDICGDCDDVLALGMIHSLQSRGACRLLAVTVSVDHDLAAPFVDAVNTFYGRGDIPIGVVRKGGVVEESKYLALVQEKDRRGEYRFPHDLTSGKNAPPAVPLLRKVLAAQPDNSVVIAQVGFSTNLADLLGSSADEASPLDGKELVARKVKFLSIMAGAFAPIEGKKDFAEYNVIRDLPSFHKLVTEWPTRVAFSGFEIGIALPYPAVSIERDYAYVSHHPLAEAYVLHNPPPHERPTWDLTSVLFAVLGDRGYFDISPRGVVTVATRADRTQATTKARDRDQARRIEGATSFREDPQGKHVFLVLRPEQRERVREALVQLSSQPPTRAAEARP